MKRALIILMAVAAVTAGIVYAAGTTVGQSVLIMNGLSITNRTGVLEVFNNKGLKDIRTITVQVQTDETSEISVKLPKIQSITVGGLTSVTEEAWYYIPSTGTFTFPWCDSFTLRSTNGQDATVDIWYNEMTTLDAQTNAVIVDAAARDVIATNWAVLMAVTKDVTASNTAVLDAAARDITATNWAVLMAVTKDVAASNTAVLDAAARDITATNWVDKSLFGGWFTVLTTRLDQAGFDTTAD